MAESLSRFCRLPHTHAIELDACNCPAHGRLVTHAASIGALLAAMAAAIVVSIGAMR